MITKGPLSVSQQESGRRNFNKFNFFNGLSFVCVGNTVIILFALQLGCPDYSIAILSSFMFLSYFFMPLGKVLLSRWGATRLICRCWITRNLVMLLVALLPLFSDKLSVTARMIYILIASFLFFTMRSIGVIAFQPMTGEITTPENRGKFVSSNGSYFYKANIVMLGLLLLLLNQSKNIWVLAGTIVLGACLGITSILFISRIKESEDIRESARKPIKQDALRFLKDPMRRRQMIANCIISSAITLTVPICVLALKNGYGLGNDTALLFNIVQIGGSILASYIISLMTQETGPRPLAILFYSISILLSALWFLAPDQPNWIFNSFVFILAGAVSFGGATTMTHYYLVTIPSKERVAASLTMYVVSGLFAGLVGSVLGGGLIDYLHSLELSSIEIYRYYFLCVTVFLSFGLLLVIQLKPIADRNVREVLSLVVTPRDVMTLFNLYGLKTATSPMEERANISRLRENKSELSERIFLAYLNSPDLLVRREALNALGDIPFGRRGEKAVLEAIEGEDFELSIMAARIAGEHKLKSAIPALRRHLDSPDLHLCSRAALSLAQLHDSQSFGTIKSFFTERNDPCSLFFGASALSEIGDDESFDLMLEKIQYPNIPYKTRCEIIYSLFSLLGPSDDLYAFLKFYTRKREETLRELAEQCAAYPEIACLLLKLDDKQEMTGSLKKLVSSKFPQSSSTRQTKLHEVLSCTESEIPLELLLAVLKFYFTVVPDK